MTCVMQRQFFQKDVMCYKMVARARSDPTCLLLIGGADVHPLRLQQVGTWLLVEVLELLSCQIDSLLRPSLPRSSLRRFGSIVRWWCSSSSSPTTTGWCLTSFMSNWFSFVTLITQVLLRRLGSIVGWWFNLSSSPTTTGWCLTLWIPICAGEGPHKESHPLKKVEFYEKVS